jgi:hypothetical protein
MRDKIPPPGAIPSVVEPTAEDEIGTHAEEDTNMPKLVTNRLILGFGRAE